MEQNPDHASNFMGEFEGEYQTMTHEHETLNPDDEGLDLGMWLGLGMRLGMLLVGMLLGIDLDHFGRMDLFLSRIWMDLALYHKHQTLLRHYVAVWITSVWVSLTNSSY